MVETNAKKAKSVKEELLELLERSPKIYSDAVKWTLARHNGIRFSSLVDYAGAKGDRESMLKELQKDTSFCVFVNDSEGSSEVMVQLTEKGRDQIIDLFYSGKEKRELKCLLKRLDSQLRNG